MILAIKDLLGKTYDTMYNTEPYLALCNPALDVICPLGAYTDLTLDAKINEISELNLCVHKYTETGELNPCYGFIEKRKYILVKGVGYFRISECSEQNTGDDDIKKVITAESKEAEIANINVPDLGQDVQKSYVDARGVTQTYNVTSYTLKLYDEDEHGAMSRCVISVIASVLKNWTFNLSRFSPTLAMASSAYTFGTSDGGQDSIGDNVYNFLTGEVADAFDVLFLFDTLNSQIYPVYREEYYDKTSLFFDRANIVESITKNEKKDTFCTCLELSITDDLRPYLMAANPTGMYLYDFSYFIDNNDDMKWMNNTIKARIEEWEEDIEDASSGVDAQALRCLEAWNAELNMHEVATQNENLYDKQCEALKSSLNGLETTALIENLETYYTNSAMQGSVLSQIGAAEIAGAQTTYNNVTIGECERRLQMLRSLTSAMLNPDKIRGTDYDQGNYANSTFNIEGMKYDGDPESDPIKGYHVWTPKFRVFQNTDNYIPVAGSSFPWAGKNQLETWVDIVAAQTKTGTTASGTYTISLDQEQRTYSYTPFSDDSDGQTTPSPNPTTAEVIGMLVRLHYYHYDETTDTFFKLHLPNSSSTDPLYKELDPPVVSGKASAFDSIPSTGYYYVQTIDPTTGNTTYTPVTAEVNYMRVELFINDPYLITNLLVYDPRLWVYVYINHLLDFNSDRYLPENYFTAAEYAQVSRYIETLSYSNDNIVVTEYDDMAEREQLALDFLEAAKKQLSNTVVPVMECSVNSGSAIFSDDYDGIRNELTLGAFARVEFDENQYAELPLEEVNINWQECSFGMTFGTFRKKGSRWSDLLSQTLSTQRQVDIKATEAYSFVKDNTLGSVKEALIGGLNTNKMRVYSSETDYQIDQYGATWTSVDKDDNKYQIVIADGTVACVVTDKNNRSEVKTALGKYIHQGVIRYGVYGGAIIAETIEADAIKANTITGDKIHGKTITAGNIADGEVGGWTITNAHMKHQTNDPTLGLITDGLISPGGETVADKRGVNATGNTSWELLLGKYQKFGVDTDGNLYANDAHLNEAIVSGTVYASAGSFSGTITADSGSNIGGWIIDSHTIRDDDSAVSLISNNFIPLGSAGVGRTLIGNFACGSSSLQPSGASVSLPNYNSAINDTNTWQILSGIQNNMCFGVTDDGHLYTKSFSIMKSLSEGEDRVQVAPRILPPSPLPIVAPTRFEAGVLVPNSGITTPDGVTADSESSNAQVWGLLTGVGNTFTFGMDAIGDIYITNPNIGDSSGNIKTFTEWMAGSSTVTLSGVVSVQNEYETIPRSAYTLSSKVILMEPGTQENPSLCYWSCYFKLNNSNITTDHVIEFVYSGVEFVGDGGVTTAPLAVNIRNAGTTCGEGLIEQGMLEFTVTRNVSYIQFNYIGLAYLT